MSGEEYHWHYDYARLAWDSGFGFQNYRLKPYLDKNIGLVDIDQIIKERDISVIEKHITTIIEFSLDNEQTSILDPNFVKIFRLGQLAVQYLLFCKRYLDNTVVLIKKEFLKNKEEYKNLKRYVGELKQEIVNYRKQAKELKSALSCQIASTQNAAVYQCKECPKAFSTEEYLLAHIIRRHEHGIIIPNVSFQAETDKLQLEIKELKERLNNTEKFIRNDDLAKPTPEFAPLIYNNKPNTVQNPIVLELQQKFELLKSHVESELQLLQTQKFDQEKYEEWFETFLQKHKQKGGTLKDARELKEISIQTDFVQEPSLRLQNKEQFERAAVAETQFNEILSATKGDNTTQTDFAISQYVICTNCQTNYSSAPAAAQIQEFDQEKRNNYNAQNEQENHKLKPVNHIEKFEELLQEKVTGSIEQLENRMQTFWNKMNEIENEKLNPKESEEPNLHIEAPQKVIPKPRKRISLSKQNSSPLLNVKPKLGRVNSSLTVSSVKLKPNSYYNNDESSNNSTTSEESESSDSSEEDITIHKPIHNVASKISVAKPSTASTLGQRSLTSLKQAAFTNEVQTELRKEVEKVLNTHMEQLGVSPNWSALPLLSYQRATKIVAHQALLAQKHISNYKHIRSKILKDLDKNVHNFTKENSRPQNRSTKVRTFLTKVKNKAKAKILSEKQIALPASENLSSLKQAKSVQIEDPVSMYASDTESDSNSNPQTIENTYKPTNQSKKIYSNVIQELSATVNALKANKPSQQQLKSKEEADEHSDMKVEVQQAKGVLKNYPSNASLHKKKVIFDLEPSNSQPEKLENKTNDTGSTTSIASSVFDGSKVNLASQKPEKKVQDLSDVSDWDLSEILD